MNTRNENQPIGSVIVPAPEDDRTFRQALRMVLTEARKNGLQVGDQSWKCVSKEVKKTWDVEITIVKNR